MFQQLRATSKVKQASGTRKQQTVRGAMTPEDTENKAKCANLWINLTVQFMCDAHMESHSIDPTSPAP